MFRNSANNAHAALTEGCRLMRDHGVERESRNGPCLQLPAPLCTTVENPLQRVVFQEERDANPFFHLFESMWMLAGRNDVTSLEEFNSNIHNYSDDGEVFNGAYGHRWRYHFGSDQLKSVIRALKENKDCRRQVISHWDAPRDLGSQSKDVPCNLQIIVQVNPVSNALDMMITNRSNDLIWGAYGANVVHFSFLLEYLATSIGIPVGVMHQVSMNTHLYTKPHKKLMGTLAEQGDSQLYNNGPMSPYDDHVRNTMPLMSVRQSSWDSSLKLMFEVGPVDCPAQEDPFIEHVLRPTWLSYGVYRTGNLDGALTIAKTVASQDWMVAMTQWLERRIAKRNTK